MEKTVGLSRLGRVIASVAIVGTLGLGLGTAAHADDSSTSAGTGGGLCASIFSPGYYHVKGFDRSTGTITTDDGNGQYFKSGGTTGSFYALLTSSVSSFGPGGTLDFKTLSATSSFFNAGDTGATLQNDYLAAAFSFLSPSGANKKNDYLKHLLTAELNVASNPSLGSGNYNSTNVDTLLATAATDYTTTSGYTSSDYTFVEYLGGGGENDSSTSCQVTTPPGGLKCPPNCGNATPELGSGELLATGLLPIGAILLYRRRRNRRAS